MKESIYNQKIVLSEELIKMIIGKDKEDFIYYQ